MARDLAPYGELPTADALSGGALLEELARHGNPDALPNISKRIPMRQRANCHLSFSGIMSEARRSLVKIFFQKKKNKNKKNTKKWRTRAS